jgi:hypothetical protein
MFHTTSKCAAGKLYFSASASSKRTLPCPFDELADFFASLIWASLMLSPSTEQEYWWARNLAVPP